MNGDTLNAEARFAILPEWVLFAKIPHLAVRLYAVLARHADEKGVGAFPSRRRLGELLDAHPSTIDRALGELIGIGAVTVSARFRADGGRSSNGYTLRVVPPTHERAGGSAPMQRPPTHQRVSINENPGNENQSLSEANASLADAPSAAPAPAADREERKLEVSLQLSAELGTALKGMTKAERKRWFVAIEQLLGAGATGEQVRDRVAAYRRRWPDITCTAWALVHHWSSLAADVTPTVALDRWIDEAPSLFDRQTAVEILDDRPGLDAAAKANAHYRLHAAYDRAAA